MADNMRSVFRWKDAVEVTSTWAYDIDTAWENAVKLCRPASMRDAPDGDVRQFLEEYGEVVRWEA